MKRFAVLIIVLCLVLCACKTTNEENTNETFQAAPTEAERIEQPTEESKPVYSQLPMVAISLPALSETTTADDGTNLFRYTHQNIHLIVQDQEIADRIIIDYLNRIDDHHAIASHIQLQAQDDYSHDNSSWTPYFCDVYYTPTRLDSGTLSLSGTNVFYNGGNHPNYECFAANYNMSNGDVLTLGSILESEDSCQELCDLVVQKAAENAASMNLYEDYETVIFQRFSRDESFDEDWYFTQNGIVFFFAPYEIAPYRSGIITIEVPYDNLTGILSDEFFPAEEDLSEGSIQLQSFSDANVQNYTQIAELIIDPEGELYFFSADGLVRDVRIDCVHWNEDQNTFVADYTAFATPVLSPGDGVTLQILVPETLPNLRITYRTGSDIITKYIAFNVDGSLKLADY